jgi:hypothetical protein
MVRLATVGTSFHARVIAARLGSEGIVTELRGNIEGLYPVGDVHVYVGEDDLAASQELLLADEVESAFDDDAQVDRSSPREAWLVLFALLLVAGLVLARWV